MDLAFVEFVSQSTIGIVNVELGFTPDACLMVSDHAGVPVLRCWVNNTRFPNFPAANSVVISGGSAAFAPDTNTIFKPYAGAEAITSAENDNTAGKHINRAGGASAAGRVTSPGITLSAGHGVNSGRNFLLAFRGDM